MKQAVQIKCPNCQNVLRVPPDAVDVSLKCKHCGYILQIKKKAAAAKPAPAAPAPAAKTAAPPSKSTGANGRGARPAEPNVVPEVAPPPPPVSRRQTAPAEASRDDNDTPAAAPSDYTPAFERAGSRYSGRGKYKGPRGNGATAKLVAVGFIVLVGAGVLAAALLKPDWFRGKSGGPSGDDKQEQASGDKAGQGNAPGDPAGVRPKPAAPMGPFPRRILAIGLSNYLYANPIQYGTSRVERESDRRDFYKVIDRLAASWKVPKDQLYFVTDGPLENGKVDRKHPPLKMVVTGAIDRFLASSRPQDRVVIVFAGHAVEIEGQAYLVPLEGDLDEPESLIPLKDVYEKLAKCPAQEKLVVFDVCRYDPGRGFERPAAKEGMSEALEKALHASPDGVSVWTSCSAGQFSYEFEYSQVDIRGLRRFEMYGSIFLNMFYALDVRGRRDQDKEKKAAAPAGPPNPADPLPLAALTAFVNDYTNQVVKDLERKDQTPKFTPKSRAEWLAYDAQEPLAARVELPTPPPTAKRDEVVAMFEALRLPPLKSIRKAEDKDVSFADNFPFTEQALKDYGNDGPTFEDIQKAPEKYMKDFPLRVATVQALVEMRKLRQDNERDELPEEFRAPISDATKKTITDKYQRTITDRQGILEEQRDALEQVAKKKEMEKSKRWLATYDYAYAQTRLRLAYIYEYNLALGKVKLEQLPELEKNKNQVGWKLATAEKMVSPKEIRDMAEEGKTALSDLVKDHPNTPWAVMAKTQRHMELGLRWQASSFEVGGDK